MVDAVQSPTLCKTCPETFYSNSNTITGLLVYSGFFCAIETCI